MNYYCRDCGARFHSINQTSQQQRNGLCPYCGGENIIDVEEVPCLVERTIAMDAEPYDTVTISPPAS